MGQYGVGMTGTGGSSTIRSARTVEVFGIRHHGPGSARSLRAALEEQKPDLILIEGPPEADALVPLVNDPDMSPPVALLAYVPGEAGTAAFWPFAEFSPEWQAMRYANLIRIPVRFCDLPAAHQLALREEREAPRTSTDPIAELATAAGYDDPERWWEDVVEHVPGTTVFDAVAEAMAILRDEVDQRDLVREAYMRKTLRAAIKDGYQNIAVVCGAWHVPALNDPLPPASHDDRLLRGQLGALPKIKAAMTWVPWTYGRLAFASGYGAGVRSPGWYDHLFTTRANPIESWLTRAAGVLREEGIPVSPAHVIEATRLADALAALRGRPLAGLEEVTQAAQAVLADGSDLLLALIQRKLVVGERLGAVPPATPMVPLQQDLQQQQRTLRLRPDATTKDHALDLRKPTDLARSHLLHRLLLLRVRWGTPSQGRTGHIGTFRESWQLTWRPELDLALIEASMWGSTVESAAVARARALAARATALTAPDQLTSLAGLTALTERCLLADLASALPAVLTAVRERAALDTDIAHLMAALPALVRAARYGDVRGTDPARLGEVAADMIIRVCAGLPVAVASLDEDAARVMRERIDGVHSAPSLLGDPASRDRWLGALARLKGPPLIGGRVTRLLLDAERVTIDEAATRMTRELSAGAPAPAAAGWVEGFLSGSGLLLVHDERLLRLTDSWLAGLDTDTFQAVLPALRRTFGTFAPPERRAIGERAVRLGSPPRPDSAQQADKDDYDTERAAPAIRAVAEILGLAS